MIRLFRNAKQNMISPGKTGNYLKYAIGEILLVMIGILLAVTVNNVVTDHIDRKRELKYLSNIKLDLQKDIKSLDYQITFREKRHTGTHKLLAQIKGLPVDNMSELTFNVINSLMQERFTPNNTTYRELSSSGNLNLISNDSIKLYLLELQELYNKNNFGFEHESFDYHEYISKPGFRHLDIDRLFPVYAGTKTAEEQQVVLEDFRTLFQNQDYKNGLTVMTIVTEDGINLLKTIDQKSKKVIQLIDQELQ